MSYLKDLQFIVNSIDIDEDGKLSFQGKPYKVNDNTEASRDVMLIHNLTNLIYTTCYTRNNNESHQLNNTDDNNSFLLLLKKANNSTEHFDCLWKVNEIELTGNILVVKGGYKRYTYAGDFIREHFVQGPIQRGELINIRVLPDKSDNVESGDAFYYVFGDTLLDNNYSSIVRIYFNIKSKGAVVLTELISKKLNQYNIPFIFKCLNKERLFTRCDAAVLYIDKRYFNIVGNIFSENYIDFNQWLNPEIPMFTKFLAPGISFAENPFTQSQSFGTNRCNIIAQGIIDVWKKKQTKAKWMDGILKSIHENYLIPEKLYLNPNSKYPYHFTDFEI